jgi:hypothetical protein
VVTAMGSTILMRYGSAVTAMAGPFDAGEAQRLVVDAHCRDAVDGCARVRVESEHAAQNE